MSAGASAPEGEVSIIPPPKRLSDVKREQELKLSSQKDNSSSNNQSYAREVVGDERDKQQRL